MTPQDELGPRGTNQGQRNRSGPEEQIRASKDEPGQIWTNQGAAGRIRARITYQGPMGRTRSFQDESWARTPDILPTYVNLGPPRFSYRRSQEFLVSGVPWAFGQ